MAQPIVLKGSFLASLALLPLVASCQSMPSPHNDRPKAPVEFNAITADDVLGHQLPHVQNAPHASETAPLSRAAQEQPLRLPKASEDVAGDAACREWCAEQKGTIEWVPQDMALPEKTPETNAAEQAMQQTQVEAEAKPAPVEKAHPAPVKPTPKKADGDAPIGKLAAITLDYMLDAEALDTENRLKLSQMLEKVPYDKIKRIHIVSQTDWGPLQTLNLLGFHRARYVKGILRERGIDTSDTMISEIHVRSRGQTQQMKVNVWY